MKNNRIVFVASTLLCSITGLATTGVADDGLNGVMLAQADTSSSDTSNSTNRQYGLIRKKENLWNISKLYRPVGSTMSQTMMAIYDNNRHAFYKDNINRLKVNVMLDIPNDSTIAGVDHKQAYKEATRHIAEYEEYVASVEESEVVEEQNQISDTGSGIEVETPVSIVTPDVEVTEVNESEIETIKEELEKEEEQVQQVEVTPEPPKTVKKRKPRKKPDRPLFRYSYEISTAFDDNIRRAQNDEDIREDVVTNATVKARGGIPIDSFSLFNYGVEAGYDFFADFDSLNSLNYNVNARYRFALASGFTSPIYSISAKIGGIESDRDMRDSTIVSLAANLNKWITNTINMTTGIDFKTRESRSDVFDTTETRLFANFDVNLSKTDLIYTTYTFITGDIVSSASPSLEIVNVADAIEPDDAFGGVVTNQFAYRIDADTQVLTFGYNKILNRDLSIDLSARFVDTEASGDIGYDRSILRASLLGRF